MHAKFVVPAVAAALFVLTGLAAPASGVAVDTRGTSDKAPHVRVVPVNPNPEGTFAWWGWALQHNASLPANATYTGTHLCECRCHVEQGHASNPFACSCDCPGHTDGAAGQEGPKGDQGPDGPAAPQGPRGDPGDRGTRGPTGPLGPRGPRGQRGLRGTAGRHGRDGRSIPGPEGPAGTDGGLEFGPTGPRGPPGQRGFKGLPGDTGRDRSGPRGMHGRNGNPGRKGYRGARGKDGPAGQRGVRGPVGPTGPPAPRWQTNNVLGQITAQGACLGRAGRAGYVAAVLRECVGGARSCAAVCAGLRVGGGAHAGKCVDSLSVFATRSVDGRDQASSGLLSSWFNSCDVSGCGPNYCCCHFGERSD